MQVVPEPFVIPQRDRSRVHGVSLVQHQGLVPRDAERTGHLLLPETLEAVAERRGARSHRRLHHLIRIFGGDGVTASGWGVPQCGQCVAHVMGGLLHVAALEGVTGLRVVVFCFGVVSHGLLPAVRDGSEGN